jgi:hypothetical protein
MFSINDIYAAANSEGKTTTAPTFTFEKQEVHAVMHHTKH